MKFLFFKKIFSHFKLTHKQKANALLPIDIYTWIIHGLSEFFGTLILSLGLAGLSINVSGHTVEKWALLSNGIVGFFTGFIILALCLLIFLRWSCDLNPIVSITRYLKGLHNGWYTSYKVFTQFLASIVAGAIIFVIGSSINPNGLANTPIDAYQSAQKNFLVEISTIKPSLNLGITVIFFTELLMSLILLFGYFSPIIKEKYREFMILLLISMSVWLGLLGGSVAMNPARGLAQQLPTLFLYTNSNIAADKIINSVAIATVTMILANLLSSVVYVILQGFNNHYFNPFLHKIIKFKNHHSKSLISNNDLKKLTNSDKEQKS
ncbi:MULTISPECIES: aquaporin [unclassified Mycoplasma]|uniref:aquaporin n=1 Tax=unclassified Mycoplasma TaxID=2683645 RepID=UPI00211BADD7|nr:MULTISPECIES: aquaporin [unclassified Mycoplasma]UUM20027.1 aquaporin [Mycoplasma sp. 1578d]UUM25008.1 aquaporin [Mycoplasma sp. 3686d]